MRGRCAFRSYPLLVIALAVAGCKGADDASPDGATRCTGPVAAPIDAGALACPARRLSVNEDYRAPCVVLEATQAEPCTCEGARRLLPNDDCHRGLASIDDPALTCLCEILQVPAADMEACQFGYPDPPGVSGWCYVQPECGSPPELLAACGAEVPGSVRFLGGAGVASVPRVLGD